MLLRSSKTSTQILTCLLVTMGVCAAAGAQEVAGAFGDAEIIKLISYLESADFRTRQAAADSLKKSGDDAIEPLRAALGTARLEQQSVIKSILRELERNSFATLVTTLQQNPVVAIAERFPEWDRFAKMVGTKTDDVERFLTLVKAEQKLFATAARTPTALPDLLESRATALLTSTRPAPVMLEEFSLDSYVAVLLLAGNEANRLPRATSTSISAMLMYEQFRDAVSSPDDAWRLRIAGSYIQRGRISVVTPLIFAREYKMPEGLTLARNVLSNDLRGRNGLYAMMLVRDIGAVEDILLLESVFNDRGALFVPQTNAIPAARQFSVYNGDLALAVAIALREQDPRDFGFPQIDDRTVPFRFSMETVGFRTEADRKAAREKYADAFQSTDTPAK